MPEVSKNLAKNVSQLREKKGLSQGQLAQMAGLPRSTLTYIESGAGNPSLKNLAKLSAVLQVGIEELLSRPRLNIKLIKAEDIPVDLKARGGVEVLKVLPDPVPGMEIDHMSIKPKTRMKGTPHVAQTREYLFTLSGTVRVFVRKEVFDVPQGCVLSFPGDEPHAYENPESRGVARCFSVVSFAPYGI